MAHRPPSVSGVPSFGLSYDTLVAMLKRDVIDGIDLSSLSAGDVTGVGIDETGPYYDPDATGFEVGQDATGIFIDGSQIGQDVDGVFVEG